MKFTLYAYKKSGGGIKMAKVSKKGIFSWMLFDWAAQPYHTVLITFIFAPYFVSQVASNSVDGQAIWGFAMGIGGIFIAILAPFLGAMADVTGPRKPWIALFSLFVVGGASLLWLAVPGGVAPINLILIAFVIGLIGIEFSTVFTNSMMPALVPREDLGKLSGSGWALGYIGGIVALIIVLALMAADPITGKTLVGISPMLGLDASQFEGERATGPLTAIWFLLFIIPLFLFTPDIKKREGQGQAVKKALVTLWHTIRELPKRGSYFAFLITSMFYRDGLNGLFTFGGIYAAGVLEMSITQIGIFGIIAGIAGAIGAFIGGRMDAKFGPKAVVFTSCWLLIIACTIIVSTTPENILFIVPVTSASTPIIVFYLAGSLIGASGGSLQAASRTLLVDQVEKDETTKAFGLYALTGRATSFLAPMAIGYVTLISQDQRIGITPIIVLLLLGAFGLAFVKQRQ